MKKVHIISLGDTYMFRLAVALCEKDIVSVVPERILWELKLIF